MSRPAPIRDELLRRLAAVEARLAAGEESAALLDERLALVIAIARAEAGTPATAEELHDEARAQIGARREREALERLESEERARAERDARDELDTARLARIFGGEKKGSPAKGSTRGCGPGDPLCGDDDDDPGDLAPEETGAMEGEAGGFVQAAVVRRAGPPVGVLRAVRRHSAGLHACLGPELRGQVLALRVDARLDGGGLLRDPRLSGAALDGITSDCITGALRGVRVEEHDGLSRAVAFDLVLGAVP